MENYKYGLLTYNKNFSNVNIGDYIQSIAASTFLEKVDCYLEREGLDEYNITDKIKIILNGWFMLSPENWPPSDAIIPLLVSFHITNLNHARLQMLTPAGVEYLKKHGPIGCRDYGTLKFLKKYGLPAYFSGCLTLTLGRKYKTSIKTENIYFVDVIGAQGGSIKLLLKYALKIFTHLPVVLKILDLFKNHRNDIIIKWE